MTLREFDRILGTRTFRRSIPTRVPGRSTAPRGHDAGRQRPARGEPSPTSTRPATRWGEGHPERPGDPSRTVNSRILIRTTATAQTRARRRCSRPIGRATRRDRQGPTLMMRRPTSPMQMPTRLRTTKRPRPTSRRRTTPMTTRRSNSAAKSPRTTRSEDASTDAAADEPGIKGAESLEPPVVRVLIRCGSVSRADADRVEADCDARFTGPQLSRVGLRAAVSGFYSGSSVCLNL